MDNAKAAGFYVFGFFAALYMMFSIGHFGGDGYEDYLTAESIVLDGDMDLYDRPHDPDEIMYDMDAGTKTDDGRIYKSRGGMGMPFLLVPFYLAGHLVSGFIKNVPHDYITMLFVSFANPLFSAFNCFMVFLIAINMGFKRKIPLVLSMMYGLATMSPVYARTGFAEPATTMFMLAAIYFLIRYRASFAKKDLLSGTVSIVCMAFIKTSSVIFIPCVILYLLWVINTSRLGKSEKVEHFIIFAGVFALLFFGVLLCNLFIYGSMLSFGKSNILQAGERIAGSKHFLKGLFYYIFSPGKSFVLYNLPVILGFIGVYAMTGKRNKERVLFLLIFLVNLLFYVKSFRRGSLFSWGPRYLYPSVPVLIILAGCYLDNIRTITQRLFVWALSVAGFFIALPCMFINQSKFYFFVVERLGLDEYMINFIPDLSPIKGAWVMFISRVVQISGGYPLSFQYAPDWRLVAPINAVTAGYDYLDIWFIKVLEIAPQFSMIIDAGLFFLAGIAVFCFYKAVRIR